MRAPLSWLLSYCDPGLPAEELGDRLAMHSIELERISHAGAPSPEGYVVGKVLSVDRHPDADRLSVCEVDTGDGKRTIVCGAPNVAAGQSVPVALPGAVMPDGTELGKAKLRGVESDGMILSEAELQIGDDAAGIVVLDNSAASSPSAAGVSDLSAGTPLAEVLPVSETVLELEPTSNRVDCFGIYGVAREVHAVTGAALAAPPWAEDAEATGEGTAEDYASVTVEVPELCPRFTARVFTDVQIGPSPLWLKGRLIAAGMRPINNVVDITNYVMLLTAQPLHAFDLAKVRRRRPDRPDGEGGGEDDHPRRSRAQLRHRRGPRLRPRGTLGDRRDHGRPDLRGLRPDHPGPARGRDLERGQHPPHLAQARPPLRRLQPLREAAPSRARDPGAADRLGADG